MQIVLMDLQVGVSIAEKIRTTTNNSFLLFVNIVLLIILFLIKK
jgi:hypothetical protein